MLNKTGLLFLLLAVEFAFAKDQCGECLLLTQHIENGDLETAKQFAKVDSHNFMGFESYSGFITVNKQYDSNLFFWFFPKNQSSLDRTPWVIWLNGGPGVSSLTGLFKSIGPFQVVDGELKSRNVSWLEDYSLLFIDSPVGAGFSFTTDRRGYPDNEDSVSSDLYEFLRQLTVLFPSLVQAPLFIAGSSYSGKYVPALAHRIHTQKHIIPYNLRGIVLGNALIDPRNMMFYSELVTSLGLMDEVQLQHLRGLEQCVVQLIDENRIYNASNKFNETVEYIKKVSDVSVYNYDKDPSKAAPSYEAFVNRADVRRWIHAGNATFDYNNQLVYEIMLPDIMNTSKPLLEELLEHYGVLSYSGQYDIIIAYSLSRHAYEKLQWSRREEYRAAKRRRLRSHDLHVVGYKKSGGNLVEALVRRAGHDAAGDRPIVVKYILDDFIAQFK